MIYKPQIVSAYFRSQGLPDPTFEHPHIPDRKFTLDIAFIGAKVGIEIEGGIWIGGKHGRGAGVKRDMEKNNLALLNGWRVLRLEPKDLCTLDTVWMLKMLIRQAGQ